MSTTATAIASRFVPLDTIRIDGGTQPRAEIGEAITDLYNKGKREHKLPDWRGEESA